MAKGTYRVMVHYYRANPNLLAGETHVNVRGHPPRRHAAGDDGTAHGHSEEAGRGGGGGAGGAELRGASAPLAPVRRGEGSGVRGFGHGNFRPSPPTPLPGVPGRGEKSSPHGPGTNPVSIGTYACSSVITPTSDGQDDAVPDDRLEDVGLLAELMRGGRGHADALGVDHLAHDAAGAVGGADQHLGLSEVEVAERAALSRPQTWVAVIFCRLPNRALLPASVPVRKTPSQPRIAAKNGYSDAGLGKGIAQRRIHAGVAGDVAQAEHEAIVGIGICICMKVRGNDSAGPGCG